MNTRSARASELTVAGGALLLPLAYSPTLQSGFWSPKAALLLVFTGLSIPAIVDLIRRGDSPTVFCLAFLAVCIVSAARSDNPLSSMLGLYGWGTGALFWLACAGMWALGRLLRSDARGLVEAAIVGAAMTNSVIGLAEVVVDLGFIGLEPFAGRGYGLLGNPVHLGALTAAAIALVAAKWGSLRMHTGVPVLIVLAAGLQASGSRIALVVSLAMLALGAVRLGRRLAVLTLIAAFVVGGVAGGLATRISGTVSGTSRVADGVSGGGFESRTETWWSARKAVAERPLIGSGPGRFRAATAPDRTVRMARAEGNERIFVDAHNIAIELAVTTGLLGLLSFAIWIVATAPHLREPLAAFAVALGLIALTQPLTLGTVPIAFLAIGSAATRLESAHRRPPLALLLQAALIAIAIGTSAILLTGDHAAREGTLDLELDDTERAEALLPDWPAPATIRARSFLFQSILAAPDDPKLLAKSVQWRQEAVRRDPSDPALHNELGELFLAIPDPDEASRSFRAALRRDPQSFRAQLGLAQAAIQSNQRSEALRTLDVAASMAISRPEIAAVERLRRRATDSNDAD